jgi:hypothetical protein
MIRLPEVDARCADANLFGDIDNRQATLDSSVTKITRKAWLTGQFDLLHFVVESTHI